MNTTIDLTGVTHHPAIEEIVDVLCAKTQNKDRGFFRTEVAFFLAKMAACQRVSLLTKDRGHIPVNMYALALATSGFGKGHSVNIMENDFMRGFKDRFMKDTLPILAEQNHLKLATERALRNGTTEQDELDSINAEAKRAGTIPFTFDSGTVPAVKQLRTKLLLSGAGAINLQIDEIGSNLIGNVELLNVFLELYDQGLVKGKLTKNTAENTRGEELDGKTPTNLLLFGTPSKLLDGGQTEDQFYSFLETGYARRCLFGIGQTNQEAYHSQSAEEIFKNLITPVNSAAINKWSNKFHELASPDMFDWTITVPDKVAIELLEYKIACEKAAALMPEHEEIRKAEISHRYFKTLKLAGALAFVDESVELSSEQLKSAILLVEESGLAFQTILNREKSYVKLARFMSTVGQEVTHADLLETLPYYPKSNSQRNEMMSLATAWGYKQHIIIKKSFVDGIEFFRGETLKETNLDELILSTSDNYAYDYHPALLPFSELPALGSTENGHWCNHNFKRGHRAEENVIPGFNLIVLDVDNGTSLHTAHELLKEYKFMTYTTKRHEPDENHRFRILIPINYHLELDRDDYKEFIQNVMGWLPFQTDEAADQRSKKWLTNVGDVFLNTEGAIFDALPFIPKTSKNEQYQTGFKKVENMSNMQRWFAQRIATGNRNNNMLKYAMMLVDNNYSLFDIKNEVHNFNNMLSNPLEADEIDSTIMVSVAKKFTKN